jgi:septal ring factor EnvC (AmiA/AmiB activator)
MAEAKVFPMSTFVACLRENDTTDSGVIDMLSFLTQNPVNEDFAPFAAALAKAWVYEQNPELTKASKGEIAGLGQKVSVNPLSGAAADQAKDVLEKLTELKKNNDELAAKVAELEAQNTELNEAKIQAEGKLKKFETQAAQGDKKLEVSSKKLDDYVKKLDGLLDQIEKVKKEGVVVAGAAGAGEAGGEAAGAPEEAEAGDDFGFSGGAADPFADSAW